MSSKNESVRAEHANEAAITPAQENTSDFTPLLPVASNHSEPPAEGHPEDTEDKAEGGARHAADEQVPPNDAVDKPAVTLFEGTISDCSPSVAFNHSEPAGVVKAEESKNNKKEAGHEASDNTADDGSANERGHLSETKDAPRVIHHFGQCKPTFGADAAPVEETSVNSSPLSSVPSNSSEVGPSTGLRFKAEDDPLQVRRAIFGLLQSTQGLSLNSDGTFSLSLSSDGTFALQASLFKLPSRLYFSKPHVVFDARSVVSAEIPSERFVLRSRHVPDLGSVNTMAIYVDGACGSSNSGKVHTICPVPIGGLEYPGGAAEVYVRTEKAGCCFIFKPGETGTKTFALERKGLDGGLHKMTKARAQLRAALAALHYRAWYTEGWEQVVLVTSSTYVVDSATGSLPKWWARDWVTCGNHDVKNRDLWKEISRVIGDYAQHGCKVSFWWVSEDSNWDALEKAEAAVAEPDGDEFVKLVG